MSYRALEVFPAQAATALPREKSNRTNEWLESDSATLLMSDFRDSLPTLIDANSRLHDALIEMQRLATGALVAIDGEGLAGIITLQDIHGPKPVQFLHDAGCHMNCRRDEVTVADVMTPIDQLRTVRLSDLQCSRIGDIRKTFENSTHTHLVVLDDDSAAGVDVICGMIERERLEREVRAGNPTLTTRLESPPQERSLAY